MGGLNIIFSGDVWQLPPPDGGFLGDIPTEYIRNARKYTPSPSIAHGQSLLWSDDVETGVQGVTELVECERTKDLWLRSVQDEFRRGQLTVETHAFLHGKPTMQPGSFFEGEVKCSANKCIRRCTQAQARRDFCLEFANATVNMECRACKLERGRRQLVANVATDPRFTNYLFSKMQRLCLQTMISNVKSTNCAHNHMHNSKTKVYFIVQLKTLPVQKHCVYVQTFLLKKYHG